MAQPIKKAAAFVVPGFLDAHKTEFKRLVISIEGEDKEGKTRFSLTAPDPIALISLDIGTEGVVEKFIDDKKIVIAEFDYKDATNPQEWLSMWTQVKSAHYTALANPKVRTIAWDTETEMWELARLARFGKLTEVMPHQYGVVNAEFRDMIRKVYGTDKNMIITHKLKDEYVKNASTGRRERAGFSGTRGLVQVNVRTWRHPKSREFGLTIINCRQNEKLAGEELVEPMNSFPYLAAEVYPDTSPEEWT